MTRFFWGTAAGSTGAQLAARGSSLGHRVVEQAQWSMSLGSYKVVMHDVALERNFCLFQVGKSEPHVWRKGQAGSGSKGP